MRLEAPTLDALESAFELWRERPRLLDPAVDAPWEHLEFLQAGGTPLRWYPAEGSERGRYTIEVLGLNPRSAHSSSEPVCLAGVWEGRLRRLRRDLDALGKALHADPTQVDSLWTRIETDYLQPEESYPDRSWWVVHTWRTGAPEREQRLPALPFPNVCLARPTSWPIRLDPPGMPDGLTARERLRVWRAADESAGSADLRDALSAGGSGG